MKKLILLSTALLVFNACVQDDEYGIPPYSDYACSDEWTATMTIQELTDLVEASPEILSFEGQDEYFEGYVVSSDSTGNFFKTVSLQNSTTNPTAGLQVEMDRIGLFNRFPLGSKVRVKLNGLYAGLDGYLLKVGQTYEDDGVTRVGRMAEIIIDDQVKRTCEDAVAIVPTVFASIEDAMESGVINTLVTIQNVQFAETGVTYANAETQQTVNRILEGASEDTNDQTIILRNSGFADFAGTVVPEGSGSITAVFSRFGSDYQLFIRDTNDVQFNEPRYAPIPALFEDGFTNLNNWTTHSINGAQVWETRNFGNPVPCAYMSGFASGNQANEDWLVSKAIAVPAGFTNAIFSFETDRNFTGNALEVFYTTNFTGDVTTTSWISLPAVLDTVNQWGTWTNSGNLDVSSAIGGNLYVAFKYTSTTSGAATWELDNVKVDVN